MDSKDFRLSEELRKSLILDDDSIFDCETIKIVERKRMKSWKRLRLMNWQIKRLHFGIDLIQSDSFFLKFSKLNEFKIQSNGSLLTQAPQPEHLDPKLYRTSWSSLEREISPIEFDVIEPIDDQNGKGIGWTIVFIHGLGSQNSSHGYQWREYLLSTMYKPTDSKLIGNLTGLKFILPKASIIPITVYSDLQSKEDERPGWFDIKDWRDLNFLEDEKSLRESCIQISSILLNQIRQSKIEMKKTIIAGFSQGAVMALLTTLALFEPPAATLMLSGYLPLPFRLPLLSSTQPEFYKSTSLYWIHGTEDNVLNYNSGKSGFNLLNRILPSGFNQSKFKTISALDHGFSVDQRLIVLNWIERIVTNQSNGEFDQSLDNLIQLENPIDDPRY